MIGLRLFAMIVAAATLAGCMTVGPDYTRPQVDLPEQWPGATASEPISPLWWKLYGDPVLEQMVDENKFRRDLYHRLKVGVIRLPALRERAARVLPVQLGAQRAEL